MNDTVVDVILLDVPVALWAKARAHVDAVLSELGAQEGAAARLAELQRRIRDDYEVIAETADAELKSATVRRLETVDVAYPVPRRARADVDTYVAALNELDKCSRAHGRKDLVTPKDCKAFWKWYYGEIAKQLDGGFPSPWPGD